MIEAVNEAMVVMIEGTPVSMDARLSKIGELVLAIRRDLLRRTLTRKTALSCNDYKGHISPGV